MLAPSQRPLSSNLSKRSYRALLTKLRSSPLLSDPWTGQVSSDILRRRHLCYHTWDSVKGTFIGLELFILPGILLSCYLIRLTTALTFKGPPGSKPSHLLRIRLKPWQEKQRLLTESAGLQYTPERRKLAGRKQGHSLHHSPAYANQLLV